MLLTHWKRFGFFQPYLYCFMLCICISLIFPGYGRAGDGQTFPGVIEPVRDIVVKPKARGTIAKILVKEGDHVKKGDLLLVLDNRLESLDAQRKKAIWQDKSALNGRRSRREIMESLLAANQKLYDQTRSVSKDDLDKQRIEYERMVSDEKETEAREKIEKIEYEMAMEQLRKKSITAPISGIIVKRFLSKGESCDLTDPLFRIVDNTRCRFICNLEEKYASGLHVGEKVGLKVRSGNKWIGQTATIVFISPVADPGSGLITVKAEFENKGRKFFPGVPARLVLSGQGAVNNPEAP